MSELNNLKKIIYETKEFGSVDAYHYKLARQELEALEKKVKELEDKWVN